ncbi:hypothetical protein Pst134EA_019440 [Puccinia striiformis f. sp. tritici]|uniref:hypothetical protein n=1 Tax=Puccinia striiformis f. sp. tritici TaxID=168172 RepID=UPI002007BEF3|nr:hypothetical protein Pst134EA_019440 [Puccinia striiformis f. sp. tritici]KAH9459285.1 hypothetical protein Pst134EA_019440 [Puccinia striiformis f. sp. tritici]
MDGIQAATELQDSNDDELKEKIATQSMQRYNQVPKPPQVNTVVNLLLGQNTFLLAATGFGKSRISELYLEMLPKDRNRNIYGLVAVLNPLDALGNNQVEEKNQAASTSINLKKSLAAKRVAFTSVYFSPEFQSKLALVGVDEAHMIYSWGLVKGGQKKLKP